jgi:hypothetical protein
MSPTQNPGLPPHLYSQRSVRAWQRDREGQQHRRSRVALPSRHIIYFGKPADWKFQFTTPNASTHYVYFNFNLKDGAVVLDVPPTVGAGLFGSLTDAWQVPLTDVGAAGDDQGKRG